MAAAAFAARLRAAGRWYHHKLETRPVLTKTLTAATIAGAGDVTCQKLQANDLAHIDVARTGRLMAWAATSTPAVHHWYRLLLARLPASPMRRVAADQVRG
jgi:protein Mpv17